jgi:hypothetical protein
MEENRPVRGDSFDEEPGKDDWGHLSRYGRRGLLLGAAATGAGAVVALMAGAQTAGASDGDAVLIGESNSAKATTAVSTKKGIGLEGTTSEAGYVGVQRVDASTGGGYGILGASSVGIGVGAESTDGPGVYLFHSFVESPDMKTSMTELSSSTMGAEPE